jgi:hypothetical protein
MNTEKSISKKYILNNPYANWSSPTYKTSVYDPETKKSKELKIPLMNGEEITDFIYELGKNLTCAGCVVELGTWLGGSLAPVADAISKSGRKTDIYCYDRFCATEDEVLKARTYAKQPEVMSAVSKLKIKQNTLPIVKSHLDPFNARIIYNKGDILKASWVNEPIELYMDDVCKSKTFFLHALKTFSPFWIPKITTLVLMDFNYYASSFQREFIKKHKDCFKLIRDFKPSSSCSAFLYEKSLNLKE